MTLVVLRCPNCGTTQAGPGECDACHEAQVRYFCTNHRPGQWLTSPKCPQCGAQFGVSELVRSTPSPRPRPRVQASVQPPAVEVAPLPTAPVTKRRFNPWGPTSSLPASGERDVLARRLRGLIARPSRDRGKPEAPPYDMEAMPVPVARAGCLGRALLLVFLTLGILLLLFISAGGPFIQILLRFLLSY